jgi:6-pyruvoyl-tetrahydropterin synthase
VIELEKKQEKLNIYHLWIDRSGYEEYDGFVVISKDLESAKKLILSEYDNTTLYSWKKKEIHSKLIGKSFLKEQIILASFIHA